MEIDFSNKIKENTSVDHRYLKKYKVLIVGGFPPKESKIIGGIVSSCQALMKSSFPHYYNLILIDSTQISNPAPSIAVRSLFALRRFFYFLKKLFLEKPDVVVLFASMGSSVLEKGAMAWIARLRYIPVLLFPRHAGLINGVHESFFQRLFMSIAMRGATHFLCQGPTWQRFAVDIIGFPKSKSPVILNWTAKPNLLSIGKSRSIALESEKNNLLFLGWLEKEKGIFELLEACLSLSKRHDFKMVIAGKGHAENQARLFVQSHALQDVIEFAGWVQEKSKDMVLANADVLILPSWHEGFPNAIIEAMAAKLAVIISRVGNVPDLIEDRNQALLIPPKDPVALEQAIELLLTDKKLLKELAERGHVFSCDNFSVEQGVAKLITAIDGAIAEYRAN